MHRGKDRASHPRPQPGFRRLPHLPGTIFIGDSGGSPRVRLGMGAGCGEGHRPLGGNSEPGSGGGAADSSSACVRGGGEGWAGGPGDINIQGGPARPVMCPDLERDVQSEGTWAQSLAGAQADWAAPPHHPTLPPGSHG